MPNASSANTVAERFNTLNWHDSEVRGIVLNYFRRGACELVLRVDLSAPKLPSEPETFTLAKIRFLNARFFHSDIDLLGIACCGGDISSARCQADSQFMREVALQRIRAFNLRPQEDEELAGLKHFGIYLCNPSGEINIVAEDFELSAAE